jgi:hypothetical protein
VSSSSASGGAGVCVCRGSFTDVVGPACGAVAAVAQGSAAGPVVAQGSGAEAEVAAGAGPAVPQAAGGHTGSGPGPELVSAAAVYLLEPSCWLVTQAAQDLQMAFHF